MSQQHDYFAEDRALFERLHMAGLAPRVVYDIGAASAGWSAIVSAGLAEAEHHPFEPLAGHELYREEISGRLGQNPQWRLHPIALSKSNGSVTMNIGRGDNIYGSTILDMRGCEGFDTTTVSQWRLDDYVSKHRLPMPDLVKIDTQASEHLILEGGRETISKASVLLIETWLNRAYGPETPLLNEIIDLVDPMSFALFDFGGCYRDPQGKMKAVDAVFLKPDIASALNARSSG